jgi:hypothetical protein
MKNITKIIISTTGLMIGVLGLALSLPYDARPFIFGIIISLLLIVGGALGLLYFFARIFFARSWTKRIFNSC